MKISELVKNKGADVISIDCDTMLIDAVKMMAEKNIGALLTVSEEKPVGIFTERDVVKKMAAGVELTTPIKFLMTKELIVVSMDDEVEYAMNIMLQEGIRHLPVVEKGKLVSVFSIRDIMKVKVTHLEAEVHYLKDFISDSLKGMFPDAS